MFVIPVYFFAYLLHIGLKKIQLVEQSCVYTQSYPRLSLKGISVLSGIGLIITNFLVPFPQTLWWGDLQAFSSCKRYEYIEWHSILSTLPVIKSGFRSWRIVKKRVSNRDWEMLVFEIAFDISRSTDIVNRLSSIVMPLTDVSISGSAIILMT